MSATLTDRRPSAASPSGAADVERGSGETTLAGAALAAVSVVVTLGMGRLFANGSFILPMLSAVAVGHGVAWVGRRLRWPVALSLLATAAAGWCVIVWEQFPSSTAHGVPLGRSFHAVSAALSSAYNDFGQAVAPVPPTKGFVMACMIGMLTTAALADWSAFRVRALFEPLIPSFTLLLLVGLLGDDRYRSVAIAGYIVAVLCFLFVQQASLATDSATWFASRSSRAANGIARGSVVLGVVTVAAALVIGPNLPGSHAKPLLAYRNRSPQGDRIRQEATPLADIRGRLVNQSNVEVFTVKASRPAYWRLTSLDTFDGLIWRQDFSYDSAKHRLPGNLPAALQTFEVSQQFTIEALSSIWLPAAYRPTTFSGSDAMFDRDSGSLITRADTADGTSYSLVSELPHITPADLRAPGTDVPDPKRYLQLPVISPRVRALAQQIVRAAHATTADQEALALQDYFQQHFTYDLSVRIPSDESGHDERVLERFLFDVRRGYCEQFAGAYGVLARSLGLPTRIAVGFTPGERQADGLYHVRGLNAHAWPEVYLPGTGWTYFEPTPGRGAPDTSQYTGIPEQQAVPQGGTTLVRPQAGTPTTAAVPTTAPSNRTTKVKEKDPASSAPPRPARPWWERILLFFVLWTDSTPLRVLSIAAVSVLAGLGLVPAAAAVLRRRRRRRARSAADEVLLAWDEAVDALRMGGSVHRASETRLEFAARAPEAAGIAPAADALGELAREAAAAAFSDGPMEGDAAGRAWEASGQVVTAARSTGSRWARVIRACDPRRLVADHRDRQQVTAVASDRRAA